jgi:glycolate oxidase iron-sulfur subunit
MLVDYGRLLAGDPAYAARASRVSELARDAGQVLLAENLDSLEVDTAVGKVAVQTPCSLQHGLKQPDLITALLAKAGFKLVASPDGHLCCGSAGTYSILEAGMSSRLRERKLRALRENSPDLIATGNVGCQLHLQAGTAIPVLHWLELLDPAARTTARPR